MKRTTIQQLHLIAQDTKEGIYTMKGLSFTRLLHNLIREYGTYYDGSYAVDPDTFSIADKKLILSHLVDIEDYQLAIQSNAYLEALFKENMRFIQSQLDRHCDEVYTEDMEEAGLVQCQHHDNNERFWVRR